jgi:hypothetical protein
MAIIFSDLKFREKIITIQLGKIGLFPQPEDATLAPQFCFVLHPHYKSTTKSCWYICTFISVSIDTPVQYC